MANIDSSQTALTVMQVLPELDGGGVERGTLEISKALVARGHRSLVVSAGGRLVEQLTGQGGQHLTLDLSRKSPLTLLKTSKLRRLMTEQQVDLVHVRSRMPAWVTLSAWKSMPPAARPRLLTTVHGLNSVNFYSKVMTYGERVIAVSHCCRDYVLSNYPDTDPDKVIVVHRGVDSAQFPFGHQPPESWRNTWHAEFPQLSDQFVVLLPGRLTRFKGHFDFLQVIRQLIQRELPVHGLIVGGEDPRRQAYAQSLYEEVENLQLAERVTFTGHRSDIREVMCVADAVVSTSIQPPESFGRTVLEAVRLGRPTIGYAHGGVGEVLSTVYPAGKVPLQDTAAMAEKLTQVYRGELSPPEPTEEFELSRMVEKEIDLYEAMVREGDRD
ncbi:MAG: glycosyltransferase family 4 protein [Bythopirellula sp.]